jgi:GT2 family glycosyltransferase
VTSVRQTPGWKSLSTLDRLEVLALAGISSRLNGTVGGVARSARLALPPALVGSLRRALAPVRVPGTSRAVVPFDERPLPRPSPPTGPPRATIVVPTMGAATLPQCVAAVRAFTELPHELVIVDDASEPPIAEQLGKLGGRVLRNESRRGFVASANRGARAARSEVLVFLNDDVIVTAGWLTRLVAALELPRAGIVAPVTNASGDEATVPASYANLREMLAHAGRAQGDAREVDKVSLLCAGVSRASFEAIGGLDEGYGLGTFEDDELCMALRRRGRRALVIPSVFVHHHGSVSFGRLSDAERIARFFVNRRRFERRWGVRWRAPHTPL